MSRNFGCKMDQQLHASFAYIPLPSCTMHAHAGRQGARLLRHASRLPQRERESESPSQLLGIVQGSAFEGLVSLHSDAQQGRKCMNQDSKARLVSMLPAVSPAFKLTACSILSCGKHI